VKILQLIYESYGSPYGFGGAGVRAYEIYKRLKERHDITLLCMKYPGAKDGDIEGLRHIFVGTESRSLTKSVLFYTIKTADFVRRYGNDFDVVVENFLPSTPFFSKFFTRTPVLLQVQGIMEKHSLRKFNPLYSLPMYVIEGFYPGLYDRFIFVSDITKDKVMGRLTNNKFEAPPSVIPARRESFFKNDPGQAGMTKRAPACLFPSKRKNIQCHVIPNGINEELLRVTSGEGDYLLFFSRIDSYTKGLDVLVKAFEKISAGRPEMRLVLAGYEFDRFERIVSGCPSSLVERIEYVGFVTGDEKVRLLSGAKIFVLPSRHESAPVSILEAAACGKPVIVSDIPELRFAEEEGFGLRFPSGSVEGLEEKIEMLLGDDEMRAAMGRRGREYAGEFLWDRLAMQFEDVLNHVVLDFNLRIN